MEGCYLLIYGLRAMTAGERLLLFRRVRIEVASSSIPSLESVPSMAMDEPMPSLYIRRSSSIAIIATIAIIIAPYSSVVAWCLMLGAWYLVLGAVGQGRFYYSDGSLYDGQWNRGHWDGEVRTAVHDETGVDSSRGMEFQGTEIQFPPFVNVVAKE